MVDYEKCFTDGVYQNLRERVIGKISAYVRDNTLYVKIENDNFKFERTYDNFAEQIMNGLTSQFIVYAVCKSYQKAVLNHYFR